MKIGFTKYYEYFEKKIPKKNYWDIWEKDSYIRENTHNSKYWCLSIEIVGNNVCQLRCKHCYLWNTGNYTTWIVVDTKIIKSIIDQAATKIDDQPLFSQIAFLWWEPTLHPEIFDLITYVKDRWLEPILVTNWLKFSNLCFAQKIININPKIIMHLPFLPNTSQSILAQNTICDNFSYAQLLRQAWNNVLSIWYNKNQIIWNFVISKLSIDYAYDTYLFCRTNGITPFFEKMRLSNDKEYNRKYILSKDNIIKLTKRIFKYDYDNWFIEKDKYSRSVALLSYLTTPIIWKMCTSFKTWLYVQCGNSNNFWNCFSCCWQTINHWNLFNQSLLKIMEEKEKFKIFQNINSYIKYPCNKCFIMEIWLCNGWCRWDANIQYWSPDSPYPQCVFIKNKKNI